MPIANVTLNNTFDEWRTTTNQLISFVNDVDSGNLTKFYSNSAVLTVTENIGRGTKNYITLNVSSNVLDTSTLNVATANAVNIVFASLANTEARIILVSNDANGINAVANAGSIQANTARVHANAAFATANAGFDQANTARIHANTAHASANAALGQANTARSQANAAIVTANAAFDQANTARVHANTAHASANSGLNQANTAYDKANSAYDIAVALSGNTVPTIQANKAAFDNANSAYEQANTARTHANAAFAAANNASTDFSPAFIQANTARTHANVSFEQANTARIHANTAHITANSGFDQANTARVHANTAHASANAGLLQANTARDHANTAHASANAALLQANTARDHANGAHASANAGLIQANTARVHANAAFTTANAALPNTSGASFAGNMQIPSGNLTIGDGTTQGLRLSVTGYVATSNVLPQIKASGGSQFIQLNANTSVGAWSDLIGDRDASIIYSRGTSDDSANLVIGPWTDSSFGYKQDGAGRHGFNTINPRHVLDANGSANISGSLTVNGMNVVPTVTAAFAKANTIGTLGTQSSSSVSISGGSITGITDLALADGGTNASLTASAGAVAYSTASAIALTAVGNSGEVLVSKGTGAPAWAALIPAGTAMLFAQTAAPTGWTKSTTHNDKALRVVSGTASSGGTVAFTTAFASKSVSGSISSTTATGTISGTVGSTTLTEAQIPAHTHTLPTNGVSGTGLGTDVGDNQGTGVTGSTGGGGSHTHSFSGSFSGSGHSHTFTGTAIDLAVQYVDVIIATKDAY